MKTVKFLIMFPVIFLAAAGCNSATSVSTNVQTTQTQNQANVKTTQPQSQVSVGSPRMIYRQQDQYFNNLFISDLDGSNKNNFNFNLSNPSQDSYDLTIHGDGITVATYSESGDNLWSGDTKANFNKQATLSTQNTSLVLSPDKTTFVFSKAISKNHYQLWIQDLKTQKQTLLLDNLQSYFLAPYFSGIAPFAFSADGSKVYLQYIQTSHQAYDGLGDGFFVFDLQTKTIQKIKLTDANKYVYDMMISPDNSKLAYTVADSKSPSVFSLNVYNLVDNSKQEFNSYQGTGPFKWSPDGTAISYTFDAADGNGVKFTYITLSDGTSHDIILPSEAGDESYLLPGGDVLYGYMIYAGIGKTFPNGDSWDDGIGLYDAKTKQSKKLLDHVDLLGVSW